jgi:hypothetical protein
MYIYRIAFVFKTALSGSVWMNGGKAPNILSVFVRWRRVVTVTLWSLYRRKNNVSPWTGGKGVQGWSGPSTEKKIVLHFRGSKADSQDKSN